MKATLVRFPVVVNEGDECKGTRLRTYERSGILFENETRRVLFVEKVHGKEGDFFEIIGVRPNGSPELGGYPYLYYWTPDGPMEFREELQLSNEDIEFALAEPDTRKNRERLLANLLNVF